MRRGNILWVAALLMATAILFGAERLPENRPKLVMASTAYDFGVVKSGTPLRHAFSFKNEGASNLQVLSVKPG